MQDDCILPEIVCFTQDSIEKPCLLFSRISTTQVLHRSQKFAKILCIFAKLNITFANCSSSPSQKISSPTQNSPNYSPSGLHPVSLSRSIEPNNALLHFRLYSEEVWNYRISKSLMRHLILVQRLGGSEWDCFGMKFLILRT